MAGAHVAGLERRLRLALGTDHAHRGGCGPDAGGDGRPRRVGSDARSRPSPPTTWASSTEGSRGCAWHIVATSAAPGRCRGDGQGRRGGARLRGARLHRRGRESGLCRHLPAHPRLWAAHMAGNRAQYMKEWRDRMDPGLVACIDDGMGLTAVDYVEARAEKLALGYRAPALRALRPLAHAHDLGGGLSRRAAQSRALSPAPLGLVPVGLVQLSLQLHPAAGRHGAGRAHAVGACPWACRSSGAASPTSPCYQASAAFEAARPWQPPTVDCDWGPDRPPRPRRSKAPAKPALPIAPAARRPGAAGLLDRHLYATDRRSASSLA